MHVAAVAASQACRAFPLTLAPLCIDHAALVVCEEGAASVDVHKAAPKRANRCTNAHIPLQRKRRTLAPRREQLKQRCGELSARALLRRLAARRARTCSCELDIDPRAAHGGAWISRTPRRPLGRDDVLCNDGRHGRAVQR